jgi:hypothetical protein
MLAENFSALFPAKNIDEIAYFIVSYSLPLSIKN